MHELRPKLNSTEPLLLLYPSKAVLIEQEVKHAHCDHAPPIKQGLHHIVHEHDLQWSRVPAPSTAFFLRHPEALTYSARKAE